MSKSLAAAYGIKRKKMAEGGAVEKTVWDDLESKVRQGFGDKPREEKAHSETQEEKYAKIREQNKNNMGYAKGGVVHDPESVVSQIRKAMHKRRKMAEGGVVEPDFGDETYPDADLKEFDPMDEMKPPMFDEGGQVKSQSEIAQDSMRKAFHFDDGGEVESEEMSPEQKKKNRMKNIMASFLSEDES